MTGPHTDDFAFRAGTGVALPGDTLSNATIEERLHRHAGWIERRTGVRERRIAPDGVGVSEYAIRAGRVALADAGLDGADVELLLLATSTPDTLLPPTAPAVAHALECRGGAMDLAGACSGFVYALGLAARWMQCGARGALVIGANLLSRRVNWQDPRTAAIFADGAGALALAPPGDGDATRLLGVHFASDGEHADVIRIPAGGSRVPFSPEAWERGEHLMQMSGGEELFRLAVRAMTDSATVALANAGVRPDTVDWFVPHQANERLVRRTAANLRIPPARCVVNLDRVGNTSAASIPIALHEAVNDGRIRRGQTVLIAAAGAGLTAGAAVLRW